MRWHNNNFIAVTDGTIKIFHFLTGDCVATISGRAEVLTLDYSPNGGNFTAASGDGIIRTYDDNTVQIVATFEPA